MKASPSNYLIYDILEAGCSRIILRSRNQPKGRRNFPKLQTSTIFNHLLSLHPQRAQKPLNRYILYKTSPKSLHYIDIKI